MSLLAKATWSGIEFVVAWPFAVQLGSGDSSGTALRKVLRIPLNLSTEQLSLISLRSALYFFGSCPRLVVSRVLILSEARDRRDVLQHLRPALTWLATTRTLTTQPPPTRS